MMKIIGPGGWEITRSAPEVPPNFDPNDQPAVRALLSKPEWGEMAPADVGLLSITLKGPWAPLAAEASSCRYVKANS